MSKKVQQPLLYSTQAADFIRAGILSGDLKLGQRLNEVELASSFGISRSPLREGIRILAQEGLVVQSRGRGYFVASFPVEDVRELLELREALDVLAIRLAARRATDTDLAALEESLERLTAAHTRPDALPPPASADFHVEIYEVAGNGKLTQQGRAIHTQLRVVRFQSGATTERVTQAHAEHLQLLEALRRHDADEAEQRMRTHLARGGAHILQQLGFPGEDAVSD